MEYLRRDEDEWQRCELVAPDSAPPQEVPGTFNLEIAITFDMVVDNRVCGYLLLREMDRDGLWED
ncbi:hypothetical protein C7212DRAFT_337247, partial [Tuber magnatum]